MSFAVSLSLLGLVAIAAPMVASVLVALFPRPYAKWFSVLGAAVSTVCTIALAANFAGAGMPDTQVPLISFGQTLVMGFTFDRMSTLLAPAFVGIGLLVVIYSIPYMSENNREHPDAPRRRFYAYLATFIGAMAGLVYSSTLLGQLVFFEITGACSWGLISYYMTPTAKKAGMKALIITHIGALGLYHGRGAIVFARHRHLRALPRLPASTPSIKAIVLLLVLFAAWAKSAQVPTVHVAALRNGGPHARFRLPPWRVHGEGRRVRVRACTRLVPARFPRSWAGSPLSTPWSPCSLVSLCTCRKRT